MQTFLIPFSCYIVHHLECEHSRVIVPKGWGGEIRPFSFFSLGSHVGQTGLKLTIVKDDLELRLLVYTSPECWGCTYELSDPVYVGLGIESKVS